MRDANPKLEHFAVNARRTPKQILHAHLPDQRAQFCLDLRAPSRFPAPIATKAVPMPAHQRLGTEDRDDLQDRRKPTIELDEEPAIVFCEPSPAFQLTPKDDQLMSENRIIRLKPALRLQRRGQHGPNK